jgi:uncharacterized protein YlxW (UPF0749 family)
MMKIKGIRAQVAVALVCILLGFLITYQIKLLNKNDKMANSKDKGSSGEHINEIENLKKDIVENEKKNTELMNQIKKYENMATNADQSSKFVKDQLDETRVLLGLVDVQGQGIVITLTPKSSIFAKSNQEVFIMDIHLLQILNELRARGAEAVAINDKRIANTSGIKSSSNNSYILVNDEKVSPRAKIEILAIGQKSKFKGMQEFVKGLDFNIPTGYEIKVEESDSIKMPKYNKSHSPGYFTAVN